MVHRFSVAVFFLSAIASFAHACEDFSGKWVGKCAYEGTSTVDPDTQVITQCDCKNIHLLGSNFTIGETITSVNTSDYEEHNIGRLDWERGERALRLISSFVRLRPGGPLVEQGFTVGTWHLEKGKLFRNADISAKRHTDGQGGEVETIKIRCEYQK